MGKRKSRYEERDLRIQRFVNKAIKAIKIASYILALGVAAYGAWWFTIPSGEVIGVILIIASLLISVLASRELKVKEDE
ncbi:MAG: hypothetical protein QXK24_00385 [Ignisphaera sp.]|uniref:Uncharacterized protein n=1 Tax=Ignisphaera aggregans TaxID=334771 RepID=A0A7C4H533_9CREN